MYDTIGSANVQSMHETGFVCSNSNKRSGKDSPGTWVGAAPTVGVLTRAYFALAWPSLPHNTRPTIASTANSMAQDRQNEGRIAFSLLTWGC